jgi:hypothetical protein
MRGTLLVACLASGCINEAEVQLKESKLLDIRTTVQTGSGLISLELARDCCNPSHDAAVATDCVQLEPSTKIAANGTAGTIGDYGAYNMIGTTGNCETPMLSVSLAPVTPSIDIALTDDSATIHVGLDVDATNKYQVTRCDAAACSATQF